MDPVQRNDLLTRIALFLGGCTIYLFLLVMGLEGLREASIRRSQLRQGCWSIGVALVFGGLLIVVPFLSGTHHPAAYEIAKARAAPVALVFGGLLFLAYVGLVGYEVVMTVRWLLAGRPRPLALPLPNAPTHRHDPMDPHAAPPRQMALIHRARKRLRAGR